jgi:phosphoserine phosphatase RsbX
VPEPDPADPSPLRWAVSGRPLEGELLSGDVHVAAPTAAGALLAVIDGLGHGPEAAQAARAAAAVLAGEPEAPVDVLLERCHRALRRTRGAAITVVAFYATQQRLDWIGVGNVEARVLRGSVEDGLEDQSLLLRGGVVGYRVPPVRVATATVKAGDLLILASDGLDPGFGDAVDREADPQAIADELLATHGRPTDDAIVLVARLGAGR